MKKMLAAFLALLMILFLFCACKDNPAETVTETGETQSTTAPPPTTTKKLVDGLEEKDDGWGLPGEDKWY